MQKGSRSNNRRLRRILIDCTLIDFNRSPTGIPRVTIKYLEEGYEWGRSRGVEIVPVLPTEDGLWIVRPLPAWLHQDHVQSLGKYLDACGPAATTAVDRKPNSVSQLIADRVLGNWWKREAKSSSPSPSSAAKAGIRDALVEVSDGDVLFCPAYWHDVNPEIYRRIKRSGAFIVTLIHDLLPLLFDKCYPDPWKHMFRENVLAALRYDDLTFTVSKYTMAVVKELCWRRKIGCPPLALAYNGFEPLVDPASECSTDYLSNQRFRRVMSEGPEPYIMVGSIEPKKAHIPVIQCFEALWEAGFDRRLVIIGRRGWMDEAVVRRIEETRQSYERLYWFDDLDDCDLAFAYRHCRGLIFASLGEGFGIPMIEASFYHRPTIVYDTEIAREILGEAGLYFETSSELVDGVLSLEDDKRHETACASASFVAWPTWSQLAPRAFQSIEAAFLEKPPARQPNLTKTGV